MDAQLRVPNDQRSSLDRAMYGPRARLPLASPPCLQTTTDVRPTLATC